MAKRRTYDHTFTSPHPVDDVFRAITSWAALNNVAITTTDTTTAGAASSRPGDAPITITGTKGYRRHPPSLLRAWIVTVGAIFVAVFVIALVISAAYGNQAMDSVMASFVYWGVGVLVALVVLGWTVGHGSPSAFGCS
jgi:hypothetical protein